MRIAVVGLGPIGLEVVRAISMRNGLELIAAVDIAPTWAGRPLAEAFGSTSLSREACVCGTLEEALAQKVHAIALCTGSKLSTITSDVARAIRAKAHVVSTCEELAWPVDAPEVAALNSAAQRAGVTVLGTGVNPGFVMDRLPIELAAMCVRVDRVHVERVVDAATRREPLRRKVGHGLTVDQFRAGVGAGTLGHVGLRASAALLAHGLGTALAESDERIDPVVDAMDIVLGVRQILKAQTLDGRSLELDLQMSVGAPEPHDRVVVEGDPPLDVRIMGGTHGDRATAAAVVEGLSRMGRAPRGVITVVDLY